MPLSALGISTPTTTTTSTSITPLCDPWQRGTDDKGACVKLLWKHDKSFKWNIYSNIGGGAEQAEQGGWI